MAVVGDVFGLNSVYAKQVENIENSNFKSWPEHVDRGYWGGGYGPLGVYSQVRRLDFATETIRTYPSALPQANERLSATSSNSHGYFGGGWSATDVRLNIISKLDYTTDSTSLPGTNLPAATSFLSGTNSDTYGYYAGGSAPALINTISRVDFSNDSVSLPGDNLPAARQLMTSVASDDHGYFGGGSAPGVISLISRLDFTTETNSLPGNNLPASHYKSATISNNLAGYFTGGENASYFNTISRLDFTTETNSLPGNNLPIARGRHTGLSNGQFGYCFGGQPTADTDITKVDLTTDSILSSSLTTTPDVYTATVHGGRSLPRATNHKSYGYTSSSTGESKFNRVDFATDDVNLLPGMTKFSAGYIRGTTFADSNYGYYTAGIFYPPNVFVSWTKRYDFSSETSSTPNDKFPYDARDLRSVSSNHYGYISGGQIPPVPAYFSFTARMDFSTTTFDAALNSGRNMSSNKAAHIGIQNSSYGYFGGGYKYTTETITYTTVDRLDFSTESYSLSANLTTPTSTGLMHGNGFENGSYGYFGGGYTTPPKVDRCQIYRLDFSNDTMSSGGNLNSNFTRASAMSGLYDAWWMFGSPGLSGSRRSRYNYSTDTASALPDLTTGSGTACSAEFEN